MATDVFETSPLVVGDRTYTYYPLSNVDGAQRLPFALKVLVENVVRMQAVTGRDEQCVRRVVDAGLSGVTGDEVSFMPARVLFQDFTGVPVMVDFAAMRDAVTVLGGDPGRVNPQVHCDLVIDHSVIGDYAGCPQAAELNEQKEFERNQERYSFLKWAQSSFENLRIVPPAAGICHQLNIERLAHCVMSSQGMSGDAAPLAFFDTVVGTDSHTTTVDGIGVLGWGVGGIEAEAVALGQPIPILVPQTVGIHMTGELHEGVSAMDLALTVAKLLREKGVVGKFVEAFGPGVATLSATQRTCVSNMSPEYGCTCVLFPVDEKTVEYLRLTGRDDTEVALVEAYAKAQGVWGCANDDVVYSEVIELDLGSVGRSCAGPSRPHELIDFNSLHATSRAVSAAHGRLADAPGVDVEIDGRTFKLRDGAIAICAITSCTTTADPYMMVQAGLLARNAREAGIDAKPWVKRLLSPGSHASELLLRKTNLLPSLEELGFYTCGFGCMSCIGNSGPILSQLHEVSDEIDLSAVVSGNRNFEGRISPDVSQNYLASPATVVACSLAGTVDFDFVNSPLATLDGRDVFLADIWPSDEDVCELVAREVNRDLYSEASQGLLDGSDAWRSISCEPTTTYAWDDASTYIRKPPYFDGMTANLPEPGPVEGARALVVLGDFVTTDHISPAGSIANDSPAARYLEERGVERDQFNTYGSRRGNHEVMERGTFANVKLQNALACGRRGCWTRDLMNDQIVSVWDASENYAKAHIPLVVLAGQMYGSGSSRDWAAKGPMLQGVRAVFAQSFERIHRSNLVGMGIMPLQFEQGESAETIGLDGTESFDIEAIDFSTAELPIRLEVTARAGDGKRTSFNVIARVDTPTECVYMAHGGILQFMVRSMIAMPPEGACDNIVR